jgi:LEA14-like dessication related protein
MKKLICLFAIVMLIDCTAIKERLAIKECKFALVSVTPYDFSFSDLKLDFVINVQNPNSIDAVLDRLEYDFLVNQTGVFSGTTGEGLKVPSGKSAKFTTTITLAYTKIGSVLVDAIRLKKAAYEVKAKSFIDTPIGAISYPVDIKLK